LATAALTPDRVEWRGETIGDDRQGRGNWASCAFSDAQEAQFDAVFAAHDVVAIDAARAQAQANDDGDRQQARDAVASLTVFIDTFGTLTAARRNDALLLALRCIRLLIRLLLRRGVLA
jgi:hypothetical protein